MRRLFTNGVEFVLAMLMIVVGAFFLLPDHVQAGIIQAIIPAAVPTANKIGNGTAFQIGASANPTAGNCASFDAGKNIVDFGAPCNGTAGSVAFNNITSGTNTSMAGVVGNGASLSASGTGTIVATSCPTCTTFSWFGGTVTAPVPGNWSAFGSGCSTSTVTGAGGGNALQVISSSGAQNICGLSVTVAAGDFSHVFIFYSLISSSLFGTVAVGFTDGTKTEYCGLGTGADNSTHTLAGTQAKSTALSGGTLSAANGASGYSLPLGQGGPQFFRLTRTGTNLACDTSPDGVNYFNLFNDTVPFLTASSLYFGADPRSGSLATGILLSYQ